jgi:Sec-independent protein secretion pathway component TatC
MLSDAAFVLVQLRVVLCPGPIFAGAAVRVTPRRLIVAVVEVVTPFTPVAVAVYVVVAAGTMVTEPERASEVWSSVKTEGLIATESAFVLFHVSTAV